MPLVSAMPSTSNIVPARRSDSEPPPPERNSANGAEPLLPAERRAPWPNRTILPATAFGAMSTRDTVHVHERELAPDCFDLDRMLPSAPSPIMSTGSATTTTSVDEVDSRGTVAISKRRSTCVADSSAACRGNCSVFEPQLGGTETACCARKRASRSRATLSCSRRHHATSAVAPWRPWLSRARYVASDHSLKVSRSR